MVKRLFLGILAIVIALNVTGCSGPLASYEAAKYLSRHEGYVPIDTQLAAVKYDGDTIRYIKSPWLEVQLAAVEENPSAIRFIKKPMSKVQLTAVKEEPEVIKYIKNPTKKVQFVALAKDPSVIKYIKNPQAIQYVKNPSKEIQLLAVKTNPRAIQYIKNPSKELQLLAVKKDPRAIRYIKNPSKELQLLAVKQDPTAIEYIKNPSKEVQLAAVYQNKKVIKFIKNPSKEVELYAYGKLEVQKPSFSLSDKRIEVVVVDGVTKIINKTNDFIDVISFAEYQNDDIYNNQTSFSIPPQGIKVAPVTKSKLEVFAPLEGSTLFGYAIRYKINNKIYNLFKTKEYSTAKMIQQ